MLRVTRFDLRCASPRRDAKAMTRQNSAELRFLLGLGVGVAASLLVWRFKLARGSDVPTRIYVLLGLKIGLAAMLTCLPRWRVAAAGLLTSMFAGAMIFLFTCGGSW